MITAVDSSALLSIFKGEREAQAWLTLLIEHAALGELTICEVVAAEIGSCFPSKAAFVRQLDKLGIELDQMGLEACYLAGSIFRRYRNEGGKRDFLIPDFLIGAHAIKQADAIIAADRGYLRHYFSGLKIIGIRL